MYIGQVSSAKMPAEATIPALALAPWAAVQQIQFISFLLPCS